MNPYINDLMAFADLLAACNVIHEEAVYDADGYDGGTTMCRIAEAHRRLRESDTQRCLTKCGWRGMAGGNGGVLPLGQEGGHRFSDGSGSLHNETSPSVDATE